MKTKITIYTTDNIPTWYEAINYEVTEEKLFFETKEQYYTFILKNIVGYSIKK